MARAIWSGSISFGLVNVPVKVFTAVREHSLQFHQVEKATGARIRYQKVSEQSGQEVAAEGIELGYEFTKGKLVTVDPDQLSELRPRTTKTIDITDFVALSEIDPMFYDRTYWLVPDSEAVRRPYGLLVHAMQDRQQVGVGTVVMHTKQYLAVIRPLDGALALSTMHFADEVVARSDLPDLPTTTKPASRELRLATQIIDTLSTTWDPGRYHDTYTNQVKKLIEQRAQGRHITGEESPAEPAEVVDLVAALEASLKGANKAGRSRSGQEMSNQAGRRAPGRESSRRPASARKASSKPKASGRKTAGSGRKTQSRKTA
jgi:DNA end-binding protein Ku